MPQAAATEDGRTLRIDTLNLTPLQGTTVTGSSQNFASRIRSMMMSPVRMPARIGVNFLIPLSTYGRWVPDGSVEDRNAMKTQIMESGPVVATMLFTYLGHGSDNLEEWGYTHHDPTDYYPYPGPMPGTNHQVVIVGWKDDTSITNGGYWIVKNSLSEEWGYDGFFNLEYGSLNIDRADINWVDYNPGELSVIGCRSHASIPPPRIRRCLMEVEVSTMKEQSCRTHGTLVMEPLRQG